MDDLSSILFFLRLEPDIPHLTHQNGLKICSVRGDSSPRMFKSPALRNLEAKFIAHIRPYAPATPWTGPVCLETDWLFRAPGKLRLADDRIEWKTTKPDTDNLIKTFKDCLVKAGFVKDDALICSEKNSKYYTSENAPHGVKVCVSKLNLLS